MTTDTGTGAGRTPRSSRLRRVSGRCRAPVVTALARSASAPRLMRFGNLAVLGETAELCDCTAPSLAQKCAHTEAMWDFKPDGVDPDAAIVARASNSREEFEDLARATAAATFAYLLAPEGWLGREMGRRGAPDGPWLPLLELLRQHQEENA